MISNQPKEKPLIDIEGILKKADNLRKSGYESAHPESYGYSGPEGIELSSQPLNAKEESIVGDVQLKLHQLLTGKK